MIQHFTQKGNPHQLTIKQHVFPTRSIERFIGTDGKVCVQRVLKTTTFKLKPSNKIFCAQRVWNERAETGYMQGIESRFQALADRVVCGFSAIGQDECSVITEFYALWHLRGIYRDGPLPPHPVSGLQGENLTIGQEEILEMKHVAFVRRDQTYPGATILGLQIQRDIDLIAIKLQNVRWGIVKATEGEFLVPDTFGGTAVVPLTPSICLIAGISNAELPKFEVAKINGLANTLAVKYRFARCFSKCPK